MEFCILCHKKCLPDKCFCQNCLDLRSEFARQKQEKIEKLNKEGK